MAADINPISYFSSERQYICRSLILLKLHELLLVWQVAAWLPIIPESSLWSSQQIRAPEEAPGAASQLTPWQRQMLVMWPCLVQIQWLIKQKTNKQQNDVFSPGWQLWVKQQTLLTSDYRREGVLTGHRRCLAEAAGIQGVLSNQLSFLLICHAWRGQHLCSFLFFQRFILLVNNTKKINSTG